jgi:signal transduction histidine kinase/CheY-like chemotaxis protein
VSSEERFLVLAPTGRDGPLTEALLSRAGLAARACRSMAELVERFEEDGAAGLLLAEEALGPAALDRLDELLSRQPSWSDLPVVLFTGEPSGRAPRRNSAPMLARLGNVTLLDRPVRPISMVSTARAALRARRRQYAARDELVAQQRAVRQRDQFLAMLGHELRNPLSAILMAVEVMERGGDREALRAIVRRQASHLGRLVDDLLDVSRVTSGKVVLQRVRLELGELVARSLQSIAIAVDAEQPEIAYARPARPLWVDGDPVRLEQVVSNIVTNAIKYTPPGGRIALAVRGEGEDALIEVADTGVGLAPDMLHRVFDLFAQAEGSLDRAKGGMGIGLTLVRSLVELHRGTVTVESPGLGQGCTFTVRLPRAERRDEPERHPEERAGLVAYDILVIEDNLDSRELLQDYLRSFGHRVHGAGDGLSGVDQALRRRPDVLVIDIGLPGIDGYEVARRVRAALGRGVYLVALSGYGQPEDRRLAHEAGFDVHYTKPVDLGLIHQLLARPDLLRAHAAADRTG